MAATTPKYVLLDGKRYLGPTVAPLPSTTVVEPIYGFSGLAAYETFRLNCPQPLVPYPLVKVYLRSRAGAAGDNLQLVIVDAAGPPAPCLQAATIGAVLTAHESGTALVTASHQLTFDEHAKAYHVESAES